MPPIEHKECHDRTLSQISKCGLYCRISSMPWANISIVHDMNFFCWNYLSCLVLNNNLYVSDQPPTVSFWWCKFLPNRGKTMNQKSFWIFFFANYHVSNRPYSNYQDEIWSIKINLYNTLFCAWTWRQCCENINISNEQD